MGIKSVALELLKSILVVMFGWVLRIMEIIGSFAFWVVGSLLLFLSVSGILFILGRFFYRIWLRKVSGLKKVWILSVILAAIPIFFFWSVLVEVEVMGVFLDRLLDPTVKVFPEASFIPFLLVMVLVQFPAILLVIWLFYNQDGYVRMFDRLKLVGFVFLMSWLGIILSLAGFIGMILIVESCNAHMPYFHKFNGHLKDVCSQEKAGECPKDKEALAAFKPSDFKRLESCAKVDYWWNEETGKYGLSVRRWASPIVLVAHPDLPAGFDVYTLEPSAVRGEFKVWPPDLPGEW